MGHILGTSTRVVHQLVCYARYIRSFTRVLSLVHQLVLVLRLVHQLGRYASYWYINSGATLGTSTRGWYTNSRAGSVFLDKVAGGGTYHLVALHGGVAHHLLALAHWWRSNSVMGMVARRDG